MLSKVQYSLLITNERLSQSFRDLTFVCLCIASIIINDDQQDAIILVYFFISNQLYMFWAISLSIIRST